MKRFIILREGKMWGSTLGYATKELAERQTLYSEDYYNLSEKYDYPGWCSPNPPQELIDAGLYVWDSHPTVNAYRFQYSFFQETIWKKYMNEHYQFIEKDVEVSIPEVKENTVKVFFNGEFKGEANVNQICQIRLDILKHIWETGDFSVLDNFYFIAHEKGIDRYEQGKEVKVTMDEFGNFSEYCEELNQSYDILKILGNLEKKYKAKYDKKI